jgi:tetratricopeptide (TPR) repeat protein
MLRYRFALLFLGIVVSRLSGAERTPRELLQEAVAFQQQGHFQEAINDYKTILRQFPNLAEVRSNLGAALAANGQYEDAIGEYKRALATKPNIEVQTNLAIAYYKSGALPLAEKEFQSVLKRRPADVRSAKLLADCLLQEGENKKVIELLDPLATSNPGDQAISYLLGAALVRDNQVARGQVLIDRIFQAGDSAEARVLMGATKMQANDFAGAREDLQKAIELNPGLADANAYYGLALMSTGDTAGGRDYFRKAVALDPNSYLANLRLGVLLRQDQEYDEAAPYLQRALRVRPGDLAARFQIASVLLSTEKTNAALAQFESIVKEAPLFSEAHVALATLYYRLKRKADGDRERSLVEKLTAAQQATQPGVAAR